ncbi:LRRN4 C-terminal-like protein [Echeneis naucrates]|uniref:LRRN4 C-terminal-like protein n=1 Tax=Echeneis naucrates TaxID=173247 RepID=UPI0011132E4B|nr:LRRN4 C-terminal-like protein [Echeneis naucrates]
MAPSKILPFPLGIICLLFIGGFCPIPTTAGGTGTNPRPSGSLAKAQMLSTEDYYDLDDPVTPNSPIRMSKPTLTERCNYNPCLEGQSCKVLADSTGCLCPGLTLPSVAPEKPNLKSVSWNGSQVVIEWCAPNSYVTAYVVTVAGKERQKFGNNRRTGAVGMIDHTAKVCVAAENDSGISDGSCMKYQPGDSSLALKAGLIGGALGFLLLLFLAILLWRHLRRRKQEVSISMRSTALTP